MCVAVLMLTVEILIPVGGGGRVGSSSSHSQGVPAPVCGGSWSQDTDLYGHHFPGSMGLEVLSCSLGR